LPIGSKARCRGELASRVAPRRSYESDIVAHLAREALGVGGEEFKASSELLLFGSVGASDDELAVEWDDSRLALMSTASLKLGRARAAIFDVIEHTMSSTIAVLVDNECAFCPILDTFSLNKKEGYAVWTKTRLISLMHDAPSTESIYLRCE
jgi:hypothetical protein